jgi:protein SCO1/2
VILVSATAILLAWGVVLFVLYRGQDRQQPPPPAANGLRGSQLPDALYRSPAPAFSLADARGGGRISTSALRGRPYALTFLFTHCPDVCPVIGQQLKAALASLGADAKRVTVVAISVDPEGDQPRNVRSWLARQRMPANFRYAIGSQEALQPVWDAYFAAPKMTGRPETSTHAAAVWLIDAQGRLRTRYPGGIPIAPEDVAADLRVLLREVRRPAA